MKSKILGGFEYNQRDGKMLSVKKLKQFFTPQIDMGQIPKIIYKLIVSDTSDYNLYSLTPADLDAFIVDLNKLRDTFELNSKDATGGSVGWEGVIEEQRRKWGGRKKKGERVWEDEWEIEPT